MLYNNLSPKLHKDSPCHTCENLCWSNAIGFIKYYSMSPSWELPVATCKLCKRSGIVVNELRGTYEVVEMAMFTGLCPYIIRKFDESYEVARVVARIDDKFFIIPNKSEIE